MLTARSQFTQNLLRAISPSIGLMTRLTTLGLVNNRLSALPRELGLLRALEILLLQQNQLTSLPREIAQLPLLRGLWVRRVPSLARRRLTAPRS